MQQSALNRPAVGVLTLSPEDVQKLLEDTSSGIRLDMTDKIASAYGATALNDKELQVAEQIFRLLLRDTELRVRVSLAHHLKESTVIPRDIVMSMARDVVEVSLPVLQSSQVLTDEDLVALIKSTEDISRHMAISKRSTVSDVVSDTLVERSDGQVLASLLSNEGAQISESGIDAIIDRHGSNDQLMETLGNRPHLPAASVEKLIGAVSSTLGETLKRKYQRSTVQIEQEVDKAREAETLSVIRTATSQEDIDKLIMQLHAFGRLNPSMILSALCQGNFAFFETSLATLSNVPLPNVRTLIADRGELGFRAIYNKSGLPDAMFPAVKLLLRVVRDLDGHNEKPGSPRYSNRVVERILQYAEEDSSIDNLSYIIALVRRVAQ